VHIPGLSGWYSNLEREGGSAGLLVIASSALGVGVGLLGLPILTIGLFMGPLHADLGWSRAQIASASTCINLATICAAPFIGFLCDRFGVRRIAMTSLAFLTVGFFALAEMGTSLPAYYAIWFVMAAGGVGTSGIVWTRAIGTFFEKNRGQALGLALTGTAFAALLAPLTLGGIITDHGWRAGYLALGCICLVTIPVTFLFFQERGLRQTLSAGGPSERSGMSLAEAVRTTGFWKIGIGIFFLILGMGSCLVHFVPLAIDVGVPPVVAGRMFAVIGFSMLLGRVLIGALLDRLNPILVATVALALPALGCYLMFAPVVSVMTSTTIAAFLMGFSAGAEVDILAFLVARYFGLRSYGAIYGCELAFFALGSGTGGLLTGYVRDVTGSYQPALIAGIFVFLIGALLILWLSGTPVVKRAVPAPAPDTAPQTAAG
jgi:MFS family permease